MLYTIGVWYIVGGGLLKPEGEEGFLGQLRALGERCKLPQRDSGHSTPPAVEVVSMPLQTVNAAGHVHVSGGI